jgi:hypothetical protein
MKTFPNPWYDVRNELSPREFEVADEPIESVDVVDIYEVLSEHQRPSVLVVLDRKRANLGSKGGETSVMGQYVTVDGAKRAVFGNRLDSTQ